MARWNQQDKFRIAERRKTVASLYLQGKFQSEIAQEVNVDRGTVSRDITAVEAEWVKSGVMDLNLAKARELAKNDEVERQAWDAWKCSRQDAEIMEVTGTSQAGKSRPEKVKKITKGQAGDPRFLAIIQECCKRRCQILGLDAPKQQEHQGAGGGPIRLQLSDEELTERVRYQIARRDAIQNGTAPPPRPTFRDGKLFPPRATLGP
jgi:hypothetical protein